MALQEQLMQAQNLFVRQKKELAELIGFETRNKYSIETPDGQCIAFAAEQQKGFAGVIFRQMLGHWRTFELHIFDEARQVVMRAVHPFRFLFQRLEIFTATGQQLGIIQQRFAFLYKKFDVLDPTQALIMSVSSPIWKIWTFPFFKNGQQVAVIQKKWGGLIKEGFTDADTFEITFQARDLTLEQRKLILAASLFIDLQYFERKAS